MITELKKRKENMHSLYVLNINKGLNGFKAIVRVASMLKPNINLLEDTSS